jgi:hypothetical protein
MSRAAVMRVARHEQDIRGLSSTQSVPPGLQRLYGRLPHGRCVGDTARRLCNGAWFIERAGPRAGGRSAESLRGLLADKIKEHGLVHAETPDVADAVTLKAFQDSKVRLCSPWPIRGLGLDDWGGLAATEKGLFRTSAETAPTLLLLWFWVSGGFYNILRVKSPHRNENGPRRSCRAVTSCWWCLLAWMTPTRLAGPWRCKST